MAAKSIIGKDGKEMVLIPVGEFIMGSNEFGPEMFQHKVCLSDYYINGSSAKRS